MFDMSAAMASWLISILNLVGIIVAIPLGRLTLHIGPKRLLIGSVGVAVLGAIVGVVAPNGAVLIASRALEGVAMTAVAISAPAIIKLTVSPEHQGAALGIWSVWFSVGAVTAGVVTPVIFTAWGYQAVWIAYALLAVIGALIVQFFVRVPDPPKPTVDKTVAVSASDSASAIVKPSYCEILKPNILLFLVTFCVYCITTFAFISYVPSILQLQGYDASTSGFISTLPSLLAIVSSPVLGVISDRYRNIKVLIGGTMTVLAITGAGMFVLTGPLLWVDAVVCGLFGGSAAGIVMVAYLKLLPRPEVVPLALAAFLSVQCIGQFLGTFITQLLLGPDLMNWNLAGAVILVIGLIGAAAAIICRYPK
jgi:MFS family permease